MANDLIQIRIPHEMKTQAEAVFSGLGLKTSDAVRVFLQQCINANGIPFPLYSKKPNAETLQAMHETETGQTEEISLEDLKKIMDLSC